MQTSAFIVDSPVEFALAGPVGSRDRLLVRSRDAALDLIGLAAQGMELKYRKRNNAFFDLLIPGRELNFVTSFSAPDTSPDADRRHSLYSFAWRGYASDFDVERVRHALNLQLPDLYNAFQAASLDEIQWALGPIIYQCSRINDRRVRFRRVLVSVVVTYAIVGIAFLVWQLAVLGRFGR